MTKDIVTETDLAEFSTLIKNAQTILVLQADNPDGDSLASSLALEAILTEMGKSVMMVCAVDMPVYLRYIDGWDRVGRDLPSSFDMSIVVDNSTESLFEYFERQTAWGFVKSKPLVVLDHHAGSDGISYADLTIKSDAVATGELIYDIATKLQWPLPLDACELMVRSIMSDSLGLTTDATTPTSIHTVANLVEHGVSIPKLEQQRRSTMMKDPRLLDYKGQLLQRCELSDDGRIASVTIPWKEIEQFSPLYNPTMLVMDDLRMTQGVGIVIGYKVYNNGRITAKLRANFGFPIAAELAEHFDGGGHPYAAGFKIQDQTNIDELKKRVNAKAVELLDALESET